MPPIPVPSRNNPPANSDFSELDDSKITSQHWKIMFISGMGFFTDAYDLFIIGVVMSLVKPLWHTGKIEEALVDSTALLASAIGALLFGRVADMLGRKRIYGVEVLVLAAGAIACSFSPSIWWLIGFRFILGIGIGGDYPVSATIMAEYAGKASRGMLVTLVFAMQAAGLILGPLFASALLATNLAHDLIWRILVGFGAVPALAVYWSRRHLKETPRYLAASGMEESDNGELKRAGHFDPEHHSVSFWDGFHPLASENRLLMRLIGASAAWFLMDAAYYGNTVSSPMVLSALNSDHTLLQKTLTQLGIFVIFAAPGYAIAALTMDRLGRKTIQCLGFGMMTVAFLLLAFWPGLQQQVTPFLVIYGLSFFFTEFGPNSTTFVYPSEIFPVRVRTTGHGIAAAMGKLGGFFGVFVFPFLLHSGGLRAAESTAAAASVLGLLVTATMLPETKGKSLEEIEHEALAPAEKLAA
ncbi:Predicted arabinose efflux permease, MFS family [Bryocella elongata]|uniref:Predicted arabinose efflux permease, MFS family n=1 Tax=Bryocella elongata TaxID=863522 RepID=A0A1H5YEU0_9BACT|nr:MFS transporter [Bryocella elongata]SEG22474.1 Predicted arabinose efflux permease, MFS family [Bryocella elongata]